MLLVSLLGTAVGTAAVVVDEKDMARVLLVLLVLLHGGILLL